MPQKKALDPRAWQRLRWIEIMKLFPETFLRLAGISESAEVPFYIWYHRYASLGIEGSKSNLSSIFAHSTTISRYTLLDREDRSVEYQDGCCHERRSRFEWIR